MQNYWKPSFLESVPGAKTSVSMSTEKSSGQLLKAQSHIWNIIFSFINSASLKCAVQLRIPDIIHSHGKPMSLSALFSALPVHRNKFHHVSRLMRILIHSGFFCMRRVDEESDEEGYVLTPSSYYLLTDHSMSLVPFVHAMFDPSLITPWDCLTTWFQTDDQTAFETTNGRSLWEQAQIDPHLNGLFNKAMSSDARLVANVVVDQCGGIFEGIRSLVDVGGGTGTMSRAITKAFPDLKCMNFDLPHVVAGLEESENLKHVPGDMFKSTPKADAIMLKWILHDWSDEECIQILENCKEALENGNGGNKGKVIIIDMVVDIKEKAGDNEAAETQLFFDMIMMAIVAGKERDEKEWADIFTKSGFKRYKITPVLGLRSLIEVFP